MGQNRDLVRLLGLPSTVKCPFCAGTVFLWFDDYDLDCHKEGTGVFEIEEIECICGEKLRIRCQLSVGTTVNRVGPPPMKIETTEYVRGDGVTMFRVEDGRWRIRQVIGLDIWFWDNAQNQWQKIAERGGYEQIEAVLPLSFDAAMAILKTVPSPLQESG